MLPPGDRVWIKILSSGYAGVEYVAEAVQSVLDFTVNVKGQGKHQLALYVLSTAGKLREPADAPETCEHFVRVKWLDTVPRNKAVRSVGFFGNQNTVCQPSSPIWRHTGERIVAAPAIHGEWQEIRRSRQTKLTRKEYATHEIRPDAFHGRRRRGCVPIFPKLRCLQYAPFNFIEVDELRSLHTSFPSYLDEFRGFKEAACVVE